MEHTLRFDWPARRAARAAALRDLREASARPRARLRPCAGERARGRGGLGAALAGRRARLWAAPLRGRGSRAGRGAQVRRRGSASPGGRRGDRCGAAGGSRRGASSPSRRRRSTPSPRGFDPAEPIAAAVAARLGLELGPLRPRATTGARSGGGGATASPRRRASARGPAPARALLVDDVLTTGRDPRRLRGRPAGRGLRAKSGPRSSRAHLATGRGGVNPCPERPDERRQPCGSR